MNANKKTNYFPVLKTFPWTKKRDSCLAFCYPRRGKPFVIKGEYDLVDKFLTINDQPILVHYEIYSNVLGRSGHSVKVYGLGKEYVPIVSKPTRIHPVTGLKEKHQRCWVTIRQYNSFGSELVFCKAIRSVPRKWMHSFDKYLSHKKMAPLTGDPFNPDPSPIFPVTPVVPEIPEPELTAEQKQEKEAIEKSRRVMASILKRVGAIPLDHNVSVFELDEEALAEMESES